MSSITMVKVVLPTHLLNQIWAMGDPSRGWVPCESALKPNEKVVEFDNEVIATVCQRYKAETFEEAIAKMIESRA